MDVEVVLRGQLIVTGWWKGRDLLMCSTVLGASRRYFTLESFSITLNFLAIDKSKEPQLMCSC